MDLRKFLWKRRKYYSFADAVVWTDNKTVEQVTDEVVVLVKKRLAKIQSDEKGKG